MIVALAAAILFILELARRALEPACPNCDTKNWTAHSTQLQCSSCGWSSLVPAVAVEARADTV